MIGHRSRFRENDDLPLRRGPTFKKIRHFSNARALITRKSMRSRDAQCNTGNDLKVSGYIALENSSWVSYWKLAEPSPF